MIDPDTQQAWQDRAKALAKAKPSPEESYLEARKEELRRQLQERVGKAIERVERASTVREAFDAGHAATSTDDEGPYLTVRVALRTPGGMVVHMDYDAEDAAAGETLLELRGFNVVPGPGGIGADDVARLKHVLAATRPTLDTYSLGRAVAEPKDDEGDEG
jgi:hypothetical protein